MTTIQNNPVNNQQSTIGRAALTGAVIGGVMKGAGELLYQKTIFKNADSFVKGMDTNALQAKKAFIAENGFIGEAVDKGLESINAGVKKAKDFITGGKFDMQTVAKQAGKGALKLGVLCAGFALIGEVIRKGANSKKAE